MRTIALALSFLTVSSAFADSVQQRTDDLVAMFNKTKHVNKQKRGTSKQIYLEIRAEPLARRDASTYSGTYTAKDFGFSLQLQVQQDGAAAGDGNDDHDSFTLRDGWVRGALLTGTRVYRDGTTAPLEAVFIRRTRRSGVSPDRITENSSEVGLGVLTRGLRHGGSQIDRVFFEQAN